MINMHNFEYAAKFRIEYGCFESDTEEYRFKILPLNRSKPCLPDVKCEKFARLTSYTVTVPVSKNHVKYWANTDALGVKRMFEQLELDDWDVDWQYVEAQLEHLIEVWDDFSVYLLVLPKDDESSRLKKPVKK